MRPTPAIGRALWVAGIAAAATLSCSFDFNRFDRPCRDDSDCIDNGTCDALRSVCAPTRYWRPPAAVDTYAGTGDPGENDGPSAEATFDGPTGIALLGSDLIVSDRSAHRLRRVSAAQVTRFAGGESGYVDGSLDAARFQLPGGLAVLRGELFLADTGNHRLRTVVADMVGTLAGGAAGFVDGAVADARFNQPQDVAVLADGRVVVADRLNHRIRLVDVSGVTTIAGRAGGGFADGPGADAQFQSPSGVAVDGDGRIIVADTGNNRIRAITLEPAVTVATLAGGEAGFADGDASAARFSSPQGVAVSGKTIFVADTLNARVRVIDDNTVATVCGGGATATVDGNASAARLERPIGITVSPDGQTIYVADQQANRIRRVTLP